MEISVISSKRAKIFFRKYVGFYFIDKRKSNEFYLNSEE